MDKHMTKETFINNNTFSGCLHSKNMALHVHLGPRGNMLLYWPPRWCDMAHPSWALAFHMLGSSQYLEPFLAPSLQALTISTSPWHHNLTWACVDNTSVGPLHFPFVPQLSLVSSLITRHCCSEWTHPQRRESSLQRNNGLDPICHWKWCLSCRPMRCSLICLNDMWQLFHPSSFCIIQPPLESVHYDFVNSFSLSIPLGISWGRIRIRYSQFTTVSPEGFAIKLKAIVRDEGTRDPEACDNVFPNKFLGNHIPNICQGLSFHPLSKVICADQQIPIVPCSLREWANNV